MKCYFAHPITIYGTSKEKILEKIIQNNFNCLPSEVINPNSSYNESMYKVKGMKHFLDLVDSCDILIIYPFEDGTIGAGIVKEALRAIDTGKRIYQINTLTFEIIEIHSLKKCLSVIQTRNKIKKIRKTL